MQRKPQRQRQDTLLAIERQIRCGEIVLRGGVMQGAWISASHITPYLLPARQRANFASLRQFGMLID